MGAEADSIKGDARDERLRGPTHNHRHREKEHVRKQMMIEARDLCHETRQAYCDCAKGALQQKLRCCCILTFSSCASHSCYDAGRTFSLPFACRDVFNKFNECLGQ